MPVRNYIPARSADVAQLVDRLADEWRSPNSAAVEPVILEEHDARAAADHVYVVWNDWGHVDRIVRGEIIMDAAERVKPPQHVQKITIAMGLTPEEADRFGINWR